MQVNANTLRKGNVMELNDKLMLVTKVDLITPGKGNAIAQVEMRDIRTGVKTNERFRTQESVERVQLMDTDMEYLYEADGIYTFMDPISFDQIEVPADIIGDQVQFLQDNMKCTVKTYEGSALSVELPSQVTLEIKEADPVVKGQTASSSYKPAVLENDVRILVPQFVATGDRIVVATADTTYVERAKD